MYGPSPKIQLRKEHPFEMQVKILHYLGFRMSREDFEKLLITNEDNTVKVQIPMEQLSDEQLEMELQKRKEAKLAAAGGVKKD